MNAAGQSLCLTMIVKNKAPIVRRCLDSVPLACHEIDIQMQHASFA
jgi:hypothetical protein